MRNPKRVTVGDIMSFYKRDKVSSFSSEAWTDENGKTIAGGTKCIVIGFKWVSDNVYYGYDFDLLLPDGTITVGWGEYAVEPVWMKRGIPKNWYDKSSDSLL
jgi:hypothetical protein